MSLKRNSRTIAISGGGIAGLTSALLLEQQGFRVRLFERADRLAITGTGIQLSPNAFKILDGLNLGRSLTAASITPDCIEIRSGLTGKKLTTFELGKTISARHGAPYSVLHRADLSNILRIACEKRENIELNFGHKVTDIAAHPNGVTLMAEAAGKVIECRAAAVIGADGVWSELRQFVHGSSTPTFTGRIAWRAVINIQDFPKALSHTNTGLWLGPDAHLVHYPIRQGNDINIVAITPWKNSKSPPRGWLNEDNSQSRVEAFQNWRPVIQTLMERSVNWGGWPLNAVPRVGKFANGPLILIGDAAHAMVPFGAQGGAAAIEDAAVLAQQCALKPNDLPEAFKRVEKLRRPRIKKIISLGDNNRRIYHMGSLNSAIRDRTMKITPQALMQKRMDWLYGWTVGRSEK